MVLSEELRRRTGRPVGDWFRWSLQECSLEPACVGTAFSAAIGRCSSEAQSGEKKKLLSTYQRKFNTSTSCKGARRARRTKEKQVSPKLRKCRKPRPATVEEQQGNGGIVRSPDPCAAETLLALVSSLAETGSLHTGHCFR